MEQEGFQPEDAAKAQEIKDQLSQGAESPSLVKERIQQLLDVMERAEEDMERYDRIGNSQAWSRANTDREAAERKLAVLRDEYPQLFHGSETTNITDTYDLPDEEVDKIITREAIDPSDNPDAKINE